MNAKLLWVVGVMGLTLAAWGQQPVPPAATAAEVTAGINRYKYVTPYTIAVSGISSNGITAAGAEAVARGAAASGTNTFAGNGSGVTNVPVTSIVKVISQTPPSNGDTNWFGPWTPGTTTSGIQEAWDSAAKGTNAGPYIGGVELRFQDGYYFFTNKLVFETRWPFATTMRGVNLLSTKLAYAGAETGISTIAFGSVLGAATNGGLNLPAHVTIEDLSVTAINDNDTNILVEVRDYSDLNISRVNFTGWQVLTNQVDGAGVSIDASSFAAVTGSSLVGLKTWRGPEHGSHITSLYFMQLAVGVDARNDHMRADDLRFAHIGQGVNNWPITSRYSLGACVLREGGLNDLWTLGHCYSAIGGFYLLADAYNSPNLIGWNFENCTTAVASLQANARTPISYNPTVYADALWSSAGANHVLCLSNSPNYGVLGTVHTNGVTVGTDWQNAAEGGVGFEVWYGGDQRFLVDRRGTKTLGRIETLGDTETIALDPETSISITDTVNYNQLNKDGSAEFATGTSGSTAAGGLFGNSVTIKAAGSDKFSFDTSGDFFRFNDKVNVIDGAMLYDFNTGVFGFGEITATKVTTPKVEVNASGPTITSGAGAPAAAEPDGSLYLRTDGSTSTTLYVRISGAWVGK